MKNDLIRFRCTSDLKAKIEYLASKEGRTVSNYIENLLKEKVEGVKMRKVYELKKDSVELKSRSEVVRGCTHNQSFTDPGIVVTFDSMTDALDELHKYESSVKDYGNVFVVEEYYVESVIYDEDGEYVESEIWEYSHLPLKKSIDDLAQADKDALVMQASDYEDFDLFTAELGWEDWMFDFTENEYPTEEELNAITEVEREAFNEAHQ